jgi:beta-lactamase regulating signal transducer with metallopeptidase domain
METQLALALGSLKALLLLAAAAAAALALRGRPARLRAVVWATALAGSLLIPLVAPLLPVWFVPVNLSALDGRLSPPHRVAPALEGAVQSTLAGEPVVYTPPLIESAAKSSRLDWQMLLMTSWAIGAAVVASRLGIGVWRMARTVRRARPVTDSQWLALMRSARERVGCRRQVRLVMSAEVEIPATIGMVRPAVVVPLHANTWPPERVRAVLLHEIVHVARHDWPVRLIARIARAVYWFNPLAWWAVRRLDLEQELACDEEVLALGTRASSYACHLLGIARAAVRCPAPAISGLAMARRSDLEERIMTILKRSTHRRIGMAVLVPAAVLMAAMVPALAAVYPGDPGPHPASEDLKQILTEMREAEARLEKHIEKIEEIDVDIDPRIEMIERIEVEIDHAAIAEIEERMKPHLERIEEIEVDMQPFLERMEELEADLEDLEIHVEDGTLKEVERQIHDQVEAHMEKIREIHVHMEPIHEQMEAIHSEMEPLHRKLEQIHVNMEPVHEEMERIHEAMEPLHEQMEAIHREMEPIHEEMEQLGDRLEHALRSDAAAVLRDHMGATTAPGAPIDEAAARIVEEAHIHVDEDVVEIDASRREVREILTDLLGQHRAGTQQAFDDAVNAAADALSPLEIRVD